MALLEVRNLTVTMPTRRGPVRIVEAIDLDIDVGDVLGIVGESGSGKSVTMLAVMGLLPRYADVSADRLAFDGIDLLSLKGALRRRIMGKEIAMIFQEPMTRLNPCFTVGFQIMEMLKTHEPGDRAERRRKAIGLLESVGISAAERRMAAFPHQLSGGMSQRVMIAMAIACQPRLLIADEPSTALDVTIQAQILDLLAALQRERRMALVLITHDMAVVSEVADRVMVMYAGQAMELQPSAGLFDAPRHPYTSALLRALPEESAGEARLPSIPGTVMGLHDRPAGCVFQPRCAVSQARCVEARPPIVDTGAARVRCFFPLSPVPHVS
ncbi:MAG: ABC transporter ATP-binding protein [Rhizobiaceae bacterium]|nr:ABC transporter ATP-binding protein [Rhizobiaceae bacterium]